MPVVGRPLSCSPTREMECWGDSRAKEERHNTHEPKQQHEATNVSAG